MRNISRLIMTGAFALIFLTSSCGVMARANPTPVWTAPPGSQTLLPTTTIAAPATSTVTEVTVTPLIPITGENVVSMQCQFCVADETHAVMIFPDFAYFDVDTSTSVTCLTAEVVNGQRILICRGPQSTTFNLNICADPTNCLQFPVELQPCPLLQAAGTPLATNTPFTPFYLTPINTLKPPKRTPTPPAGTAVPSHTPTQGSLPATPTAPVVSTPTAPPPSTATPAPEPTQTSPPPPPVDTDTPVPPIVTSGSTGGGGEDGGNLVICHVSPGNPDERTTMTLSQSAWENEHSKHGDSLGAC